MREDPETTSASIRPRPQPLPERIVLRGEKPVLPNAANPKLIYQLAPQSSFSRILEGLLWLMVPFLLILLFAGELVR